MKIKEKLSTEKIDETLANLSKGIQPIIDNLDIGKLSGAERRDILEKLDALEAKALEVKAAINR